MLWVEMSMLTYGAMFLFETYTFFHTNCQTVWILIRFQSACTDYIKVDDKSSL